ncbi:hypothetical protein ACJX0J_039216, partial [Zea mays]
QSSMLYFSNNYVKLTNELKVVEGALIAKISFFIFKAFFNNNIILSPTVYPLSSPFQTLLREQRGLQYRTMKDSILDKFIDKLSWFFRELHVQSLQTWSLEVFRQRMNFASLKSDGHKNHILKV